MGKRSNFKRVERDFYPTPEAAVLPLLPHLPDRAPFDEPCAGEGDLIEALGRHGHECDYAWDIHPPERFLRKGVKPQNALELDFCGGDMFITNPPWDRKILHPLITHLSNIAPTWLLFDADWMHTKQAKAYLHRCEMIVSIGRVKWIPNSPSVGKDNCCWYHFDKNCTGEIKFFGR